uniref:Uncharacterized protein n=1 Tax=Rhizophagus irregularis (strain DAOM 181602 / DAOM 197198 / MUCL 43194) TaxID=747089 RepID=U9SU33_RHIID
MLISSHLQRFPANSRKDITIVDSYGLVQKFSDESSAVKDKHIRPKIPSKEYSAAKSQRRSNNKIRGAA